VGKPYHSTCLNDRALESLIEAGTLATGQIRYGWVCVDSIFTMSQPSVSRAIRPNPAVGQDVSWPKKGVTTRGLPGRENESGLSSLDLEVAHQSWSWLQQKREIVYLLQTERIILTLLATLSAFSQVVLYKEGAV
jgi:hypothetical protein